MVILNKGIFSTFALFILFCVSACKYEALPFTIPNLAKFAVDGSNVPFTVTVMNLPSSVTCFDGSVQMTKGTGDLWSGTASYANNLLERPTTNPAGPGVNKVGCTATNNVGTFSSSAGFITLIPNVLPVVIMLPTVCVPKNDGFKVFDVVLIDPNLTGYVTGATYTLTEGTLPAGLSIHSTTGHLVGTPAAGDFNPSGLKITATTVAGAMETPAFTIDINQGTCP